MKRWEIILAGKWGGTRTLKLDARNEQAARLRARERAYGHERIVAVYSVQS